jgi:hypothetical protein
MVGKIDELEPDLLRKGAYEIGFRDRARLDEESTEGLSAARLLGNCRVELGLRQEALRDQQCAKRRSVGQGSLLASKPAIER